MISYSIIHYRDAHYQISIASVEIARLNQNKRKHWVKWFLKRNWLSPKMNDCYLSWKYDIRATYVGNQKKEFPSLQRLSIGWVDQFHLTEKCRSTSYQPDMIWTRNQTKSKSELFYGNINYSWTVIPKVNIISRAQSEHTGTIFKQKIPDPK